MTPSRFNATFTLLIIGHVLVVIALGAYTRLSHAGLSCPDWPGCYGRITVPTGVAATKSAQVHYGQKVVVDKAWLEMIHRYVAGFVGLMITVLFLKTLINAFRVKSLQHVVPMFIIMVLLFHQVLLGKWTVSLKLMPIIVSLHLLTAFMLTALLWWVYLTMRQTASVTYGHAWLKIMALVGFVLVFFQIALGAWTSSNYAALSCLGFPFCHVTHLPMQYDFKHAFHLISPAGVNYEGGVLTSVARQTIQMTHRMGALMVGGYLFAMLLIILFQKALSQKVVKSAFVMMILVALQVVLGMFNLMFQLPTGVALLHNLVALMLLLSLVNINYYLYYQPEKRESA